MNFGDDSSEDEAIFGRTCPWDPGGDKVSKVSLSEIMAKSMFYSNWGCLIWDDKLPNPSNHC